MEIGLTEGLRRFAKVAPLPAAGGEDPLFCWDANRIEAGGRSLLVMVNAANRVCAVSRMTGADWKKVGSLAPELVRASLETCGLGRRDVESYMRSAGAVSLTKTHGRVSVGGLNKVSNSIWVEDADMSEKVQWKMMGWLNDRDICTRAGREGYGHPSGWMLDDMLDRGLLEGLSRSAEAVQGSVSDFSALRKWAETDARTREMLLSNAFCPECGGASFAPGWSLRDDELGFVVEGTCSGCGSPIARCSW